MRWFSLIIFFVFLSACQKESINLEITELASQTTDNIYDITFVSDDIAYYCGGQLWKTGVIGKSTDGGNTWATVLETDNVLFTIVFKNENEGVALGFSGRAWKTTDGGANWSLTESYPNYPVFSDAQFITPDKLIVAAGFNYYSGGFASYFFEGPGFGDSLINQDMQTLHLFDETEGIMAGYGGVYKTYNAARDWEPIDVRGDYFKDIAFNSGNEGVLVGYQGRVLHSNDKGESWQKNTKKSNFFTTQGNLESVAVYNRQAFICGQNGTFYYSDNFIEGNWAEVNTSSNRDFLCVRLKDENTGFICGSDGFILKFKY